jgi:hypothetical protein
MGASKGWGIVGLLSPQTPQNRNYKNKDFIDVMIPKVLCDLSFSRNQPLKSADE